MELFIDILKDTTIDTVKLIPFLFLTYLAMEYLENKAGQKTVRMLLGAGKKGPVIGGILGVVPQCGFSAAAANLYSGGVITVGTMIAVFLSTSDEMLPILISEQADVRKIMAILIGKIIVGIVAGILVDIGVRVLGKGYQRGLHIHDICEHDHCHCEEGSIVKSALIHSVQILVFIYVISFALNAVVEWIGMEEVMNVVTHYPIAGIFLAGLVGARLVSHKPFAAERYFITFSFIWQVFFRKKNEFSFLFSLFCQRAHFLCKMHNPQAFLPVENSPAPLLQR